MHLLGRRKMLGILVSHAAAIKLPLQQAGAHLFFRADLEPNTHMIP